MKQLILTIFLLSSIILLVSCSKKTGETARLEVPRYSIEQFYKNKQISGGEFSTDDKKLLVSSNESGIYNVYEINIADATLQQITHSAVESFYAIDYVPGTGKILYTADKGGNEINHIYLLDNDGSTRDLTPAPQEKANFGGWSLDKKAFYYFSNKRDPKYFDLYKINVGKWNAVMLYKNEAGYDINDLSWDEKYITLGKSLSSSENQLFILNLISKEIKEISDPKEPGTYQSSGFTKDNKYLLYITDVGGEYKYLVQYDLKTGERKKIFDTNWDVMYCYDSENEKYRVIGINADGKNKLVITEKATGKNVEFPEIPDGDIMNVMISPSEKLMRLTVGTSKAPSNQYVYNFETKGLKKLTNTLNPEIDPNNLVTAVVVRFKSFDSLEIPSILYKPLIASSDIKVPALIWVHGGPGGQSRVGYSSLIQFLVNHGYAVLAVNNRGSGGYGKTFYKMDDRNHGEKDLMDCVYGKKYLQTLNYIDKEKIGIIGGSYGGYMTMAAMAFQPEEFIVGVDIFGVTNWLRTLKSIPKWWESGRKSLYAEMGDPNTEDSVRLYNISPLFHADKIVNPVIVLQGANDPRVLQVESDEIVAAIKKNNVPVEYVIFPDEGHGFRKKENEIKGYGTVMNFLDKYLRGGKTIKSN